MATVKGMFNKYQQAAFDKNKVRYQNARLVDLPALTEERYGLKISGRGSDLRVDGEGLRFGLSSQKEWLTNGVSQGDAIQTIRQLDKHYLGKVTDIKEAIAIIESFQKSPKNVATFKSDDFQQATSNNEFNLPKADGQDKAGKLFDYVTKERSISWNTINDAQAAGFLDKTSAGIRFLGHDAAGQTKFAEVRLIEPKNINGKQVKSQCLLGSSRAYPPIWPGTEKSQIHLVEGGFSGLGLREILNRQGLDYTIIASGGKDNTAWVKQPHINQILKQSSVTIWRENEKNEAIQRQSDEALERLKTTLKSAGINNIHVTHPPPGIKDTADWNAFQKELLRQEKSQEHSQLKSY